MGTDQWFLVVFTGISILVRSLNRNIYIYMRESFKTVQETINFMKKDEKLSLLVSGFWCYFRACQGVVEGAAPPHFPACAKLHFFEISHIICLPQVEFHLEKKKKNPKNSSAGPSGKTLVLAHMQITYSHFAQASTHKFVQTGVPPPTEA